ncbi:amidohydrolase [Nocardiopsis ansamitocini]|uniref:amidohydrolase n=1 Tax=Nocardiopsis ansamitocini TaxID=1670832 RepID=UPI002552C22E|nr:amidohydrolase family protein [Nocardiopsis ansamitocini]
MTFDREDCTVPDSAIDPRDPQRSAPHTLLRDVRLGSGGPTVDVRSAGGRVVEVMAPGAPEDGARVLRCAGGTLLPGLVDAHVHAVQWAGARRKVSLAAADSAQAAVDLLAAELERRPVPAGELVQGYDFRDGLWPDLLHKDLLERALPGRAVTLFSSDLHTCWLSPAALDLIGRDHPTGVFVEGECMAVTAALPAEPVALRDRWVMEAMEAAAARGVTGVTDFEFADTVEDWTRRLRTAPPTVRVACSIARPLLDAAIGRGLRTGQPVPEGHGVLTVGPLKLFVDGSLNTRTALCHEPYPGADAGSGRLELEPEELVALMERAWAHGVEPAVHAIGDRAATVALDAFAEVGCPGRVEHAQLVRAEDLHRFAALGVVVGVQPAHAPDDRDVAERYWPDRLERAYRYADLLAAGARLEIGSDAPVAPLDPWDGIASAVARTDDERPPWHAEQAIPVGAALAAASEGRTGIAVGDRADLMVTALDPAEVAPQDLRELPVVATLLAGRPTHVADALR